MSQVDQRRLQGAYLAVFGVEESRTTDQKLVWRDIESFCHAYRMSVECVAGGALPIENTLVNEGRRSYWLRARGHILAAQAPEPVLVKTSRTRQPKPNPPNGPAKPGP